MLVRSVSFLLLTYITNLLSLEVKCALLHVSINASTPTYRLPPPLPLPPYPSPAAASSPAPFPPNSSAVGSPSLHQPLDNNNRSIPAPSRISPSPEAWPPVEVSKNACSSSLTVIGTPAAVITPPPAVPGTLSTVPTGAQPGCIPYYPCNIFFQYVGVYFWPMEGQNTACLSNNNTISATPAPSGLKLPKSPNVLAVFTSIRASDGCQQVGADFVGYTTTFRPGELSSVRDGSTYSFNFADLPCPPASVHWSEPGPYAPRIAPPPFLFNLDPAWSTCIAGAQQGIDPYTALSADGGGSGPDAGPNLGRHRRAVNAHARTVPWAAPKTTTTETAINTDLL